MRRTRCRFTPALVVAIGCVSFSLLTGCTGTTSADIPRPVGNQADALAASLVEQMTTDEKILLVHGAGVPMVGDGTLPPEALSGAGYIPGIPRLGIPPMAMADSSSGVNVPSSRSTALPAPIALAASWDPGLSYEYGELIGSQLRTLGYSQGLGGSLNLAREPRSGRTFENMGEDPILAGAMMGRRIQGTQSQKIIATIKHFALNGQETNRMVTDSQIDERAIRETELLAFEIGLSEGHPGSVMCSYNKVNGVFACENAELLTILKKEWGFKGVVQSDWGATHSTTDAALAGLDEEQPTGIHFGEQLKSAIVGGEVPMERLNDMVHRKVRTLIELGIMASPPTPGGHLDEEAGNALARKIAQQSAVLLKNDAPTGANEPVLPLAPGEVSSIVVIGGHADAGVLSGGGSGAVPPIDGNAVPDCQLPSGGTYYLCPFWYKSAPLDAIREKVPDAKVTYFDGYDKAAAVDAAAKADVAIVFATQYQVEGSDLPSLALTENRSAPYNPTYDQDELITAVAQMAEQVVVVLETGGPVLMPWLDGVDSVLAAWYPGVRGGQAIADLIFGDVNPSGKLPISFPRADSDLPQPRISSSDNTVTYREGAEIGYRWYDARGIEPLFAFGHGLSYTNFDYTNMAVQLDPTGDVKVAFTVTNAGAHRGAEVAQIYASLPPTAGDPPQRLVAWRKLDLLPGHAQRVEVQVPSRRLATWDPTTKTWIHHEGPTGITAGRSSRDADALEASVFVPAS